MKALVLNEFNTPFELKEIPKPLAGKGEVLVRIIASGVNPLDLKIKAGQAVHARAEMPGAILGIDMAGIVEAVGAGVHNFKAGDEVYGMVGGIAGVQGTLAEYAAVDASLLALKPGNISFKAAAALPLIAITAWEAIVDRANVIPGSSVLVHGGAGGVGHIAIQIALARGAKVFTTVSPEQSGLVTGYGAVPVDRTRPSEQYVDEFTDGEGFDVILDTVGGAVLDGSFSAVKRYTGHVVSILGWSTHSLAPLSFRGASYSGVFTLYPLISGKGRQHHGEILRLAAELIEAGKIKPLVDDRSFSLQTVDAAYQAMTDGSAKGKIVVLIGE